MKYLKAKRANHIMRQFDKALITENYPTYLQIRNPDDYSEPYLTVDTDAKYFDDFFEIIEEDEEEEKPYFLYTDTTIETINKLNELIILNNLKTS